MELTDETDDQLLDRARKGECNAVWCLYQRYRGAALRYAHTLIGSDAEELVAETFTSLIAIVQEGRGPSTSFRAYLFRSLHNAYVSDVRKRSRYFTTGDDALFEQEGREQSDTTSELVRLAMADLPSREQQTLQMTILDGYSLTEVAEALGTTKAGAGSLAYRSRKHLAEAVLRHSPGLRREAQPDSREVARSCRPKVKAS